MKCPKVNIIMCTYNGEKYVIEQLDSLYKQTYANITIYIRDDGSTDNTASVINNYIFNHSDRTIYFVDMNKNSGYPKGFMELLFMSDEAEYYAFCDQDDVWNTDKIQRAVQALEGCNNGEMPLLYFAAVDYCDDKLNFIRKSRFARNLKEKNKDLSLEMLIFGGDSLGMTYVFNHRVRKVLENVYLKGYEDFKDGFIKIYTAAAGKVIYDKSSVARYRRHSAATTGKSNPEGKLKRILAMIKELFFAKDAFDNIKRSISCINAMYSEEILAENQRIWTLFSEPATWRKRLQKVFWKRRYRVVMKDEIGYRILFLLGKI